MDKITVLLILFVFSSALAAQESAVKTGGYLSSRGPYDPRPFEETHLVKSFILGANFFQSKNKRWREKGFVLGGYVSVNAQAGSVDGTPHGMSESLVIGAWETLHKDNTAGRWLFGIAHDHTIGSLTTREFADRQKLVEMPDDLDTSPDKTFTTLGLLAWEQEFYTGADEVWGYRVGQLYITGYFGSAVYLDDDRKFFMARPMAAAAGAQWVGSNDIGLGLNVVKRKGAYYLSVAAIDGKANRQYPQFDSLLDGKLLYLAEVGSERDLGGPNESVLRFTISHLDLDGENPEQGPGQSLMLSAERRFDNLWAIFSRWSKSYKRLSGDYQELLSIGTAWLQPFGFDHDFMGLGFFIGDPTELDKGNEYGAEWSYKLQLTQDLSLMPDVQYWYRNDVDGQQTSTWIVGVRANFEF